MSRRTILLVAAAAALIATPAIADPECFGDSCRLPQVVDPPLAAAPAPEAAADVSAADSQASAHPPRKAAEQRVPAPASRLAPSSARPQLAAEPAVRKPVTAAIPVPPPALREIEAAADEPAVKPRTYVRAGYAAAADGALAGIPLATRPVVVGTPAMIYGGLAVQPVYLVAPSAKIIHIDSDD